MTQFCSWCSETLGSQKGGAGHVTHTLCPSCLQDLQRELAANGLKVSARDSR